MKRRSLLAIERLHQSIWICCCVLAAAMPPCNHAAEDDGDIRAVEIPVVGRGEHFYHAAGHQVKIRAEANPRELTVNDWILFTLTIDHLDNPREVEKPPLEKLPGFKVFQVKDGPTDPESMPHERVFRYLLRPRSEQVTAIPSLLFQYYDEKQSVDADHPELKFLLRKSDMIPIRVRPAPEPAPDTQTPLEVPPFARSVATGERLLHPSRPMPVWVWVVAAIVPPMLAGAGILLWPRWFPDAARRARLRRGRAARRRLGNIRAAMRQQNDQGILALRRAIWDYLAERWDLAADAQTPGEIAEHLATAVQDRLMIEATEEFFAGCDGARFAPLPVSLGELQVEAVRVIELGEATAIYTSHDRK